MGNTEGLLLRAREGNKMLGLPNPHQSMQPACPQTALVRASVASVSSQVRYLAGTTTAAGSQGLHGHVFVQVTRAPESLETQGHAVQWGCASASAKALIKERIRFLL